MRAIIWAVVKDVKIHVAIGIAVVRVFLVLTKNFDCLGNVVFIQRLSGLGFSDDTCM